ncbi:CRISPR-associated RAMP protein Csx10 [Okeanomitos corallinicola TIOX110]|uniref:CRISPR-associated RAMP protein Csx10 n=1 Tax=Okeanomitos corallinicola TIOX110 TaxID=3133117 RepID=A0ABZ2UV44_9CYAN
MKRIELQIKALSPLAISRQKPGGSISECEDYIPGSVIRGAVAGEILKQSGQQFSDLSENGGDFQALFLGDEPAIFQNAYPNIRKVKSKHQKDDFKSEEEVKILPTTALSSKTNPGFKTEENGNEKGVFDTIIDRFCADLYGFAYETNCPNDGGRVDSPGITFYSVFNDKYYKISSQKRLLTKVGINRRRATSEEEILYSIEVLNESESKGKKPKPVSYISSIIVPDNLSHLLWEFIDRNSFNFRLGGSTSRGLGKVEINAEIGEFTNNIQEKIELFNSKLCKRWKQWSIFGNAIKEFPQRTYFTLDLQADAILTENWRRTTVISPAMLQQFTGVDDSSLELHAAYSSYDYRSGWNAAWGLMKDIELVTDKGGVYLFSTSHREKWYSALDKLELTGVGERTSEGFGQVQICNEFHLVMREEAV